MFQTVMCRVANFTLRCHFLIKIVKYRLQTNFEKIQNSKVTNLWRARFRLTKKKKREKGTNYSRGDGTSELSKFISGRDIRYELCGTMLELLTILDKSWNIWNLIYRNISANPFFDLVVDRA